MLKLAQLTQTNTIPLETTSIELGKVTPMVTLGKIFAMVFPLLFVGFFIVFWFVALVGALSRKDLKENRLLWVIILLIGGPIGMIIYFFIENRKKLAWVSLILGILFALGMFVLPIIMFSASLK